MEEYNDSELMERRRRRAERVAQMKREKEKQRRIRAFIRLGFPIITALLVIIVFVNIFSNKPKDEKETNKTEQTITSYEQALINESENDTDNTTEKTELEQNTLEDASATLNEADDNIQTADDSASQKADEVTGLRVAKETDNTQSFSEEVDSTRAILIDITNQEIVAQKDAYSRMNPASMTKVLTLLVAVEHIENMEDTVTITREITDYCFSNDCSNVGFEVDETVPVKDLLYGTILPSGADAALGLANYVAGSEEAFVELMNEKLNELGLSDTAHFTNCVGIYNENHYCTAYDMAVIMWAAYENETCREVLSAHTYTTSINEFHPEGLTISNWFLRRIEDKEGGETVLCGKTGYVVESGNCAVSLALDANKKPYVCVTAGAGSGWKCIYDHAGIYKQFL